MNLPPLAPPPLPLALRAVYLRKSSIVIEPGFDPMVPNQQLQINTAVQPGGYQITRMTRPDQTESVDFAVAFTVEFGITYLMLEGGAPAAEVAHIRACFVIDYLINDQVPQFNDEQLHAWGQSQPMLHAWVFWREYCHSSMMRMNMPVAMMPLMVVAQQVPPIPQQKTRKPRAKRNTGKV